MNETSGSDVEMTVGYSIQYGILVDWGRFATAARLSAALSSVSPACVVAAFLPCGPVLSPASWRHFGHCSQPWMLRRCFLGMWGVCHLILWSVHTLSSCLCPCSYGRGTAVGPQTGRRCQPLLSGLWRAIAPLVKPWCVEGEVPTAANLNFYRGENSRVGIAMMSHCLEGCGEAKLIVSVNFGSRALFKWKGKSCLDSESELVLA